MLHQTLHADATGAVQAIQGGHAVVSQGVHLILGLKDSFVEQPAAASTA
jgi:hypothetical protein